MNTTTCEIEANPDVTGLGIRASIYTLCLGGSLLHLTLALTPRPSSAAARHNAAELTRAIDSALSMQGLALLCTSIYQTAKAQLTLFHALCAIHLLALLGLSLVARGQYVSDGSGSGSGSGSSNGVARRVLAATATLLALLAFVAWNMYVWARAPAFGSQPRCNASTVYVVFGVSVRAAGPVFRWVILATLAAVCAALGGALLVTALCASACVGRVKVTTTTTTTGGGEGEGGEMAEGSRSPWQDVGYCAFTVYAIVSLEQTIQRNDVAEAEKEWTFGQVLALFLLLGTVNELVNFVVAKLEGRGGRSQSHV